MYYFRIGHTHVWTADEERKDAVWDTKLLMRGFFSRRKLFLRAMRAYALSQQLSLRPRLLIAHGLVENGLWQFVDADKKPYLLQQWIDEHDGQSGALRLFACNSLNMEISSRVSLVIHLNRSASRWDLFKGGCLRLYHPRFGYIENNYRRLHSILHS